MGAERKRLSVTITGPEVDMLEAMVLLLRRQGYLVFGPNEPRVTVSRKSRAVLNALRAVTDGQLDALARSWRFAALERTRRVDEGER
jgi:hypothetical protein